MARDTQQGDSLRTSAEPVYPLDTPRTVYLRSGRSYPVFLFSGGGADLSEMDPFVSALRTRRPLIGVRYWNADQGAPPPTDVEAMADTALKAIRSLQPSGPYLLVGYSLGGLVALEVARKLIEAGQSVRPPVVVDSLTHRSAWPLPILIRAGIRYALQRALGRRRQAAETGEATPGAADPAQRCRDARANYRPARYEGPVTLMHASREPYIGGLAPAIWRRIARRVDCHAIEARHLEVMRTGSVVAQIAGMVDQAVDHPSNDPETRRALVLTGLSWNSTAWLVGELLRVGFTVDIVAPAGHPTAGRDRLNAFYALNPLNVGKSIEAAIMESRPDILIPGDDFVADLLHRLYATTRDVGVRELIARSLGEPAFFARRLDRSWMIDFARSAGVSVPRTIGVERLVDLPQQLEHTGCPAFLKVDGSWGGTGVVRVDDLREARQAWRRLSSPFQQLRSVKRAFFNGDFSGLDRLFRRGQRPVFSLQASQEGQLVIVSAVCLRGKVLGMISARVLSQQRAYGRATSIRMDDQLPVRDAVAKIAHRLGLSGLCGFDFILPADGDARFIELNPRATQTSTLIGKRDSDPLAALLDALGGTGRRRNEALSDGDIVKML